MDMKLNPQISGLPIDEPPPGIIPDGAPQISGWPTYRPLAVTIPNAVRLSGIGRTVLYRHIKEGTLPILKSGRRTLVRVDALDALLRTLEASDAR
jgi:excisionase family DNA binding protein